MSNNQDNITTSKEECELKKELEMAGVYQSDYSIDYMKEISKMLKESKEMANRQTNNSGNQKDLSYSNNSTNKSDLTIKRESEMDNNRAEPSCSYNTHCNNSNLESPKVHNNRKNKKKNTEDVKIKNDNEIDENLSYQKSKNNSLMESCNFQENKILSNKKDFIDQSKRWLINPLNSEINQNDVPLQQPKRPIARERLPFRLCKGAHTKDKEETVRIMNELNIHLKDMADLWLNSHATTELKFQWGTPIQVDNDNNSLGRIPSKIDSYYDDDVDMISNYDEDENIISNYVEEENLISNYETASKRKISSWFVNSEISNSSSEEELTLSFNKRSKSEDMSKVKKLLHEKESSDNDRLKDNIDKDDLLLNNNLNNEKNDKGDNKTINVKSFQGPNKRTISPEILSNVRKDTISKSSTLDKNKTQQVSLGLRSQNDLNKSDLEGNPSTSKKESSNSIQMNKELIIQLEKIDKVCDDTSATNDIVIKPLSMRNFSTRLAKQCAHLKQTNTERKRKILLDQKEALKKEEEEKEKRKQDFVKRRLQEMVETSKDKEKVLNKEKRKDRLMEGLETRSISRAQKWKDQERKLIKKQKNSSEIEENEIDKIIEEIENDDNTLEAKVMCPICNKLFAKDKIENHAAMCDQFQTEDEFKQDYIYSAQNSKCTVKDKIKSSKMTYECNICSSFKTNNGIEYEDHVNICLQDKQNSPSRGTPITIDVPDSPINSYQSISEQKNSNIDYTDQLTKITKKTQLGRKRKR